MFVHVVSHLGAALVLLAKFKIKVTTAFASGKKKKNIKTYGNISERKIKGVLAAFI